MPIDAPIEGMAALAAALMMAVSPVTGPCEGRMVMLCGGDGVSHRMLVWDDESPLPQPAAGKACHACTMEKRRHKPGGGCSDES